MDLFANYGLIGWVIVGGIAGMIAKFLMPGKDGGGILLTILLGIGGAVVAGFLGALLGFYGPGEGPGFIGAVVGAFIVLFAYNKIKGRKAG
ncbi:MAG: GlsB/YeaQ/YmgE family stress response membrane protein [Pseudomonadota bacterium]